MDEPKLIKDSHIIHRFSDVAGEPCTLLPPIQGFRNYPLVSLEEAVEPLLSIVSDLKPRVVKAKQSSENASDDLSSDESASIALYTMEWEPYTCSLYYILNSTLRTDDRERLKPWFLYLKLILTALTRLPSIRLTIYRSLKLNTKIEYEKYEEGKNIIWWGFSSCTTNKNIYQKEHFLDSSGTRTLFVIECLRGKDIGPHSFNKNNQEVLLFPATQFQVVRCDHRRDDLHKIYMKEIEPQSFLLETVLLPTVDETSSATPLTTGESIQKFFHDSFNQIFRD